MKVVSAGPLMVAAISSLQRGDEEEDHMTRHHESLEDCVDILSWWILVSFSA